MGFFNWLFGYKKKKEDERKVPYSTLTRQQIYGSYKSRNHEYANSGASVSPSNQGDDLLNPLNPLNPLSPFWIGRDESFPDVNNYNSNPESASSNDYRSPVDTTPASDSSSSSSSYDSGSSSSYDSGSSSSYDSGSSSSGSDF